MVLLCGYIIVLYLNCMDLSRLDIGNCLGCIWFVVICLKLLQWSLQVIRINWLISGTSWQHFLLHYLLNVMFGNVWQCIGIHTPRTLYTINWEKGCGWSWKPSKFSKKSLLKGLTASLFSCTLFPRWNCSTLLLSLRRVTLISGVMSLLRLVM